MNALASALLHFLWQGAAIAAVYGALRWMFPAARARYALGCLALAAMAVAPAATLLVGGTASGLAEGAAVGPAARPWTAYVVPAWLLGVSFFSLRLAGGLWTLRRRLRCAVELPEPIRARVRALLGGAPVRVLVSKAVDAPALVAWWRPAILLPVSAVTGLPPELLEALVLHELAHWMRRDHWVNLLQCVLETVLFYHPAVWWVSDHVRKDREFCCDDLAVRLCGGEVVMYTKALLWLEEQRAHDAALALPANGGRLGPRVRRLLAPSRASSSYWASVPVFAALLLVAVLFYGPPASAQPRAAAPPPGHRGDRGPGRAARGDARARSRAPGS
ncbi:MAG TPA: hypothetical protein DEH78_14280, partial [Solibacterales bacterium]|nr:hypothetical protein [Bryobacterales bacterium]